MAYTYMLLLHLELRELERSFHCGIKEDIQQAVYTSTSKSNVTDMNEQGKAIDNDHDDMDCDSSAENLDMMVGLM